jgi:AhpD family alkylhydroperoxidase
MSRFNLYTPLSAPKPGARAYLRRTQRERGQLPRLFQALAESEPVLKAYGEASRLYAEGTLSLLERQVVMLTVSRLNAAPYCVSAHSAMAEARGVMPDIIVALREGHPLVDPRLQALRLFAEAALTHRGRVDALTWQRFEHAGYGNEQALEVLVGIALKVFSNYASRMTEVAPDDGATRWDWAPPTAGCASPHGSGDA